ncbi:hypothetical protein OG618_37195 (plasmid) [Kitasatospora sp. NBC_01246]|uniref:hypothetical protein n=1 Tax=Kitasatospora sp. NBC_01246 TaxID=2903570 RepID=UPI002E372802|nr:hypothetical protein [Kitasatospora sp. NBC_01246]
MDDATRAWLLAELGTTTDPADLDARYLRLRSARAVALEVLRERRQTLLAQPLKVSINGVIAIDNTANIAAFERQIAALTDAGAPPAPDDPQPVEDDGTNTDTGILQFHARPRR